MGFVVAQSFTLVAVAVAFGIDDPADKALDA
jgi:hypothetical protein